MSINQALGRRVRQFLIVVGSSLVGIILALWLAIIIIKPGPPGRIVLATGGASGAYQQLAETWKRDTPKTSRKRAAMPSPATDAVPWPMQTT